MRNPWITYIQTYTYLHNYMQTNMTWARFPSLVGLRLRAFGAQPLSEQKHSGHVQQILTIFRCHMLRVIVNVWTFNVDTTFHKFLLLFAPHLKSAKIEASLAASDPTWPFLKNQANWVVVENGTSRPIIQVRKGVSGEISPWLRKRSSRTDILWESPGVIKEELKEIHSSSRMPVEVANDEAANRLSRIILPVLPESARVQLLGILL